MMYEPIDFEAKRREMLARLKKSNDDFMNQIAAMRAKYVADIKKADEEDMAALRAALKNEDGGE